LHTTHRLDQMKGGRTLVLALLSLVVGACGGASDQTESPAGGRSAVGTLAGRVAYVAAREGDYAVVTESLDGRSKRVHRLPDALEDAGRRDRLAVSLSRSGRFAAVAGLDGRSAFILDVENDAFEPLELPPDVAELHSIAWSPDEKTIAISGTNASECESERPSSGSLYLLAAQGGGVIRLDALPSTAQGNPIWFERIVWSPDGRRLLYEVWHGFECETRGPYLTIGLAVVNSAGSDPAISIISDGYFGSSSWSPDSKQIVMLEADWRTYTVAATGGQRPQLLGDRYGPEFLWTKRGIYTGDDAIEDHRFILVDPKSGSASPVDSASAHPLAASPSGDLVAAWVYLGERVPNRLRVYASNGQRLVNRMLNGAHGFSPISGYQALEFAPVAHLLKDRQVATGSMAPLGAKGSPRLSMCQIASDSRRARSIGRLWRRAACRSAS
jgi:dipeptidyl aminopeptidase/acylaminoacyl peptidase